ncbi:proline-rich receptor-like protein kinase PERK2, partial [Juglans microcarpa x Juglans regia]|uniref:proline-rich receptor-like protein kinase PERK2 n=1 Tax=Juglans microcarpa x Juglans regia TaxID=2249226 RepID=UPI001B7F3A58
LFGSPPPCARAVPLAPFPSSAFPVLLCLFAPPPPLCPAGRSARARAPGFAAPAAPSSSSGPGPCPAGRVSVARFRALPFRGSLLRPVRCSPLLRGFRLPCPPSCCLPRPPPFVGSRFARRWAPSPGFRFLPPRPFCFPPWPPWRSRFLGPPPPAAVPSSLFPVCASVAGVAPPLPLLLGFPRSPSPVGSRSPAGPFGGPPLLAGSLRLSPLSPVRRPLCPSVSLRASPRVSSGFAPLRPRSPSFGSRPVCSPSPPSPPLPVGRRCPP